ncbi:hypothetical protein [Streptomyces sp. NPDC002994]
MQRRRGCPADRSDRVTGLVAAQAELVHRDVVYDVQV